MCSPQAVVGVAVLVIEKEVADHGASQYLVNHRGCYAVAVQALLVMAKGFHSLSALYYNSVLRSCGTGKLSG